MEHQVVDDIYEAAFQPDRWLPVLDQLAEIADPGGGAPNEAALMLYADRKPIRFKAGETLTRSIEEFIAADGWKESRLISYFQANPFTGFVLGDDYYPRELIAEERVLRANLARGFGAMLGTIIPMPSGELAVMTLNRRQEDGPYPDGAATRLDGFHPHLARAAFIAARLGLEHARVAVATLEALGLPAVVLTARGRAIAANSLVGDVAGTLLSTAFGGVALAHPSANRLLQDAVARLAARGGPAVASIPIPAVDDMPAMVAHVLPLRGAVQDVFAQGEVLVALTTVNTSNLVPSASVLTGLFDLTPSEVRLATQLAHGTSLKSAAAACGIAFSTARSYLERIFVKTGVRQQSQLVALLKSAQPLR
ncbi:helix-turn-helix transcriptional regulator [Phreatobacter sp. AB_2022a]|uniref:helix-turn-helix transcriptional regulator n=1 Tax=Phreatobacter sp. AB_2022a TaxID=3003134 RepID=UPI00056ED758|nr:hypothetical protein [Phreatobacter sp. AB_2022a]MCZ0738286.1 helix-turn-helix transcriptional regulator [Phreatobacter sp. AB_2022a]CEJ14957.1 hypothetical protein BN1110_05292 [bacterium YEK0313]